MTKSSDWQQALSAARSRFATPWSLLLLFAASLAIAWLFVTVANAGMIEISEDDGAYVVASPGGAAALTLGRPAGASAAALAASSAVNVAVSTAPNNQIYHAAIPDGGGGMLVVWEDFRDWPDTGGDIYVQHLLCDGRVDPAWPAGGLAVTRALGDDRFPVIATDGAGGAIVAWSANYTGAGLGPDDVYAHHVLATGAVDPAWPANGLAVCTAPNRSAFPKIASDGAGGAFVVWDDNRLGRRAYIQHLLTSGADPNPAWTANGVRVCPVEAIQSFPSVCGDGAGGALVAWSDRRGGPGNYDVYVQRVSSSAALLWTAAGAPATTEPGNQLVDGAATAPPNVSTWLKTHSEAQSNALVPDGAGGCLVVWTDSRSYGTTGCDIYAQRVTSSGAVSAGWPANGLAICAAPGDQEAAQLVPDGTGGAFAIWVDPRPDTYVQHATGAGVVTGPTDGLGIIGPGVAPMNRFYHAMAVADGAGGAHVVWPDVRDASTTAVDLYAQHLTAAPLAADPAWPAGGAPLSTAPGEQDALGAIVDDGSGGFFAAWEDSRDYGTNYWDIYAQHILASGSPPSFAVAGTVTADCPAPGGPLLGVVVDAFAVGTGELSATAVTDDTGAYSFPGLAPGEYTITVMTPLGYSAAVSEIGVAACPGPGAVDFALHCVEQVDNPRTIGFWKHQVGVATGGRGSAQVPAAALCGYLDVIAAHFNSNAVNQVLVYDPPPSGLCPDKLQVAKQLLNLTGSVEMISRARQQLLALLLNVAAGYMNQTSVISADGATVSQAITFCDREIDQPAGDHELAKTIADLINNGQIVPAGMIPLSTETIAYARGRLDFRATPNPARGATRFMFTTRGAGRVELAVFDLAGRAVARLVDGHLAAGSHAIAWSGPRSGGVTTSPGVYFARLRTAEGEALLRVLALQP